MAGSCVACWGSAAPFNVTFTWRGNYSKLTDLELRRRPLDEIASEVEKHRAALLAQSASSDATHAEGAKKGSGETHEVAQRKLEQMERLKGALGMSSEQKEGDAFNRELQVRACHLHGGKCMHGGMRHRMAMHDVALQCEVCGIARPCRWSSYLIPSDAKDRGGCKGS